MLVKQMVGSCKIIYIYHECLPIYIYIFFFMFFRTSFVL